MLLEKQRHMKITFLFDSPSQEYNFYYIFPDSPIGRLQKKENEVERLIVIIAASAFTSERIIVNPW
jgi:hypothetical protein